ncbi:T family of potassium channels 18-like [Octopus vulgaris]|uniref:T family of potassium channels 18-like n=1 Tax=Octopus vulgaris TaxID=6645 RepID=A0AA36EYC7_OCTVU|nr:T family of potassium channels 18-like [Octopus vulgaris]
MSHSVTKNNETEARRDSKVSRAHILWRWFLKGLKTSIMFFFSHVGLTGSVVAYNIFGGWIFMELEAPHERDLRKEVSSIRSKYRAILANVSTQQGANNDSLSNSGYIYDNIVKFEEELVRFIATTEWNGLDEEFELQWSYTGALLYSVTVVTTIGYGHIAPKTMWGRIVTIIYAIFGIPLTLLCLRTIGSFMAGIFKFIYENICYQLYKQWQRLRIYIVKTKRKQTQRFLQAKMVLEELIEKSNELLKPTDDSDSSQSSSEDDSKNSINKEIHQKEIKKGRQRILKWKSRKDTRKKLILSRQVPVQQQQPNEETNDCDMTQRIAEDSCKITMSPQSSKTAFVEENDILFQEKPESHDGIKLRPRGSHHEIRVPVYVTLLVIAGYIFIGAVLFSLWEKNWDYLIGSYFCFVTLSTIGFGDFVPGSGVDSWSSAEKQAICTIYLLFGLAMIAMSFNLMQQEVKLKFIDLGKRIGLIDETAIASVNGDEDDEEEEKTHQ